MAVATAPSFPQSFVTGLDELLFQVCEEVQLTTARYDLAVERYNTLNKLLRVVPVHSDTFCRRFTRKDRWHWEQLSNRSLDRTTWTLSSSYRVMMTLLIPWP